MPDRIAGLYVTAERVDRGLVVRTTPEGKRELASLLADDGTTRGVPAEVWATLLMDLEECGDLHMLADSEYELVAALTSSPILVTRPRYDHERDDQLTDFDAVFWFPNYQIESELETLRDKGEVTFEIASEPQDLMRCECGFETYHLETMHEHAKTCRKG